MTKKFTFKYDAIGETCLVDKTHMAALFRALKRLGVESKKIMPKRAKSKKVKHG